MPQYLTVVSIHKKSGIPADDCVNTFAWARATALDSAGADDITAMLSAFYMVASAPAASAVAHWFGDCVDTAQDMDVDFYDITGHLGGTPHGSPIFRRTIGFLVATGTTSLPNELAVCLSFRSDYGTDVEFGVGERPRARDRGRIYFGPLAQNVVTQDATTKEAYVVSATQISLVEAAKDMAADPDNTWCVWSRSRAALEAVVDVWCDDAFDVQRRRGNDARSRYTG